MEQITKTEFLEEHFLNTQISSLRRKHVSAKIFLLICEFESCILLQHLQISGFSVSHSSPLSCMPKPGDAVITLLICQPRTGVPPPRRERTHDKPHLLPSWLSTNTGPAELPCWGGRGEGNREEGVAVILRGMLLESTEQPVLQQNSRNRYLSSSSTKETLDWHYKIKCPHPGPGGNQRGKQPKRGKEQEVPTHKGS